MGKMSDMAIDRQHELAKRSHDIGKVAGILGLSAFTMNDYVDKFTTDYKYRYVSLSLKPTTPNEFKNQVIEKISNKDGYEFIE